MMKFLLLTLFLPATAFALDPTSIVKSAINYWRGKSSYTEAQMIVHRPDWERRMSMQAWTDGNERTLVRFTAPAKDAGNASLTVDQNTWSYNPKINKVIQIPTSMRTQSWMGSDFSYDDLSKADRIVQNYTHKLVSQTSQAGKTVYVIESIPREDAPVVWGKEILHIREDNIILEHLFYDQEMRLVKAMQASEIKLLGGRLYATIVRMSKHEKPDEWTEVHHNLANFDIKLPTSLFNLANLSNPKPQ